MRLGVRLSLLLSLTACALIGAQSCGDAAEHDHGDQTGTPAAQESPLGDVYEVGLEKTGELGLVTATLTTSVPAPKYTGEYTWTVAIVDDEGSPITGAEVVAVPTMPSHGHGTYPATTLGVENEPGQYELLKMNLFMAGLWQVDIEITWGEELTDTVRFEFDLEG